MKRIDLLLKLSLALAVLLCALTVLDSLPLHDIYRDYASPILLDTLAVELSPALPDWTRAELEWNAVTFNYLAKTVLALLNIALLAALREMIRNNTPQAR